MQGAALNVTNYFEMQTPDVNDRSRLLNNPVGDGSATRPVNRSVSSVFLVSYILISIKNWVCCPFRLLIFPYLFQKVYFINLYELICFHILISIQNWGCNPFRLLIFPYLFQKVYFINLYELICFHHKKKYETYSYFTFIFLSHITCLMQFNMSKYGIMISMFNIKPL